MPFGKNIKPILINGEQLPEGYVVTKWFKMRFNSNRNVLATTIGSTGSGKSYADIRLMQLHYKNYFNAPYVQDNICFSISDLVKRIKYGKLRRGDFLMMEEAGVVANALDFNNKLVKLLGFLLQSFRSKNVGVMFNLPSFALLNKTARGLMHGIFTTAGMDRANKTVTLKPFYTQTNALSGMQYNKYLIQKVNGRYVKVERVVLSYPDDQAFLDEYEKRKEGFVNKVADDLEDVAENKDLTAEVYEMYRKKIQEIYNRGIYSQSKIGKELGLTQQKVSLIMAYFFKRGIILEKPLLLQEMPRKPQIITQVPD